MDVKQIYQLANTATKEVLGESVLIAEDWSDLVDVGAKIEDALGYEKFYNSLVNQIGKMFFVSRPYRGKYRKLFRESWEFGSIVAKVQADLMDATENEAWQIVNGASYDPYVVNLPVVSAKFFNKAVTFELDITTPVDQIKQSFKSQDEMVRFLSMLDVQLNNSMELKIEAFTERAICNLMGATIDDNHPARVIHLLRDYATDSGITLTPAKALIDADFLRYAIGRMIDYKGFLKEYSSLYNIGGKPRHTPPELLHFIVNSTFASRVKTHLMSGTYNDELVKLDGYEEASKWQGVGTGGSFADRTTIKADAILDDGTTASVNQAYIVATMFDHDAVGVLQPRKDVETAYNPKGKYYNSFHKWDSRFYNDFNENAVVFILD